jgi:hypothetical protein
MKYLIFLVALVWSQNSLDKQWKYLKRAATSKDTSSFKNSLSQESQDWLQSLEDKIYNMDSNQVKDAPFYEIMVVLSLRHFIRNQSWDSVDENTILAFLLSKGPLNTLFHNMQWAKPILGDDDDGFIGFATAPQIGVLFFKEEYGQWKLDLLRSLPLVTRGIESAMIKQGKSEVDFTLQMLSTLSNYKVSRSILSP